MFLNLAYKSLLHRKSSVLLTIIAMTISIVVILGVDHIRVQAKNSFSSSVSGTDLIVGSRSGSLNLLLYSVFRMGSPTQNMSWKTYNTLAKDRAVNWTIPIALGDSHRGYRVLGTNNNYFDHFKYGEKQALTFQQGNKFDHVLDVVIGFEVAKRLNYNIGDNITLSHGIGSTSFTHHEELSFTVTGILAPTGTPVDQTLHVSLEGLEAVHLPSKKAKQAIQPKTKLDSPIAMQLQPTSITATFIGLKSRGMVFHFKRKIDQYRSEPLMAILPGVVLAELWQSMNILENTLRLIAFLVYISALFGLMAILIASMKERSKEISLMRMMGARPSFVYWFIELEAMIIAMVSTFSALLLLQLSLLLSKSVVLEKFGVALETSLSYSAITPLISIIIAMAFVTAIPPAFIAYKGAK